MNEPALTIAAGEDLLAKLLAAAGPSIVAVIPAPTSAAERRYVAAMVALAAERRAPDARVNAVLAGGAATDAAIAGAVTFLTAAIATTGQTLAIT